MPLLTGARRALALGAAVLSCAAATGCSVGSVGQLQFRNDDRLSFTSPGHRELVEAPVTVSWRMQGFDPVGLDGSDADDRGAFVVFVDRAPMPVGKDIDWLLRDDRGCQRDPRCPDETYLADRGVYVTTGTSVTLETLPDAGDGVGNEQHYVNVVLVDGTGTRIGESAWYRPFQSERRSSS